MWAVMHQTWKKRASRSAMMSEVVLLLGFIDIKQKTKSTQKSEKVKNKNQKTSHRLKTMKNKSPSCNHHPFAPKWVEANTPCRSFGIFPLSNGHFRQKAT
jgi:hypothetical protein